MRLARKSLRFVPQSVDFAWFLQIKSAPAFAARYTDLWHCIRVHLVFIFMFTAGIASRQRTPTSAFSFKTSLSLESALARCVALFAPSMCVRAAFLAFVLMAGARSTGESAKLPLYLLFSTFEAFHECVSLLIQCMHATATFASPVELVFLVLSPILYLRKLAR